MDYPYIVHFFIMLFLAYLYRQNRDEKWVKYALGIEFIFFALRAPVVGADTWNYIRYLDGERNFYNGDIRELEQGFVLYRNIVCSFKAPRVFYMILNTIIFGSPLFFMIKKYSMNVPLSFVFANIINIYAFYFVALRQIFGLSFLLWGILYVLKKHEDDKKVLLKPWIIYMLTAFVGYQFHTSIAIYAPIFAVMYFIPIHNRIIPIVGIIVSAIVGIILQSFDVFAFFNFYLSLQLDATERLEGYLESENITVYDNIWYVVRRSVIPIFPYLLMSKEKLNHWFSKNYFIGIMIMNLFVYMPMIGRLGHAFYVFGIIVLTWFIPFFSDCRIKRSTYEFFKIAFIIIILYFTRMIIISNIYTDEMLKSANRLHPYQFFFEDYHEHPSIKYWN